MSSYECAPCGRQFSLFQHYKDHMIHSARHHYCSPCGRDFVSQHDKDQHLLHSERHLVCQWCQTIVGKLRLHNQKYHEQCPECSQWREDTDELHRHCFLAHPHLYCVPCKKLFGTPNALKMHNRGSAHRPTSVPCPHPTCARSFISKAALIQHLEADTCPSGANLGLVDHYFSRHCDQGQRFVKKRWIFPVSIPNISPDEHGNYRCPPCSKWFRYEEELISHLKSSKHKNRGRKAYTCPSDVCGKKSFYSLGNLMFHLENGDCETSFLWQVYELVDVLLDLVKRL